MALVPTGGPTGATCAGFSMCATVAATVATSAPILLVDQVLPPRGRLLAPSHLTNGTSNMIDYAVTQTIGNGNTIRPRSVRCSGWMNRAVTPLNRRQGSRLAMDPLAAVKAGSWEALTLPIEQF